MPKRVGTKVWTGAALMSYANVITPRENDNGDMEYSVAILIPKTDKETIKHIEVAIEEAKQQGKEKKWSGKIPNNLDINFRDGDDKDDEVYHGHYYVNARSKNKPQVVKKVAGQIVPIEDETDFYSGCYAIATINFFAYNSNGKKGISAGLGNLLKVRDGERLAGGASASEDFEEYEDTESDDENYLD